MTPKILVTGGTGTLGRQVTARLLDRGAAVRILSRGEHASGADTEYVRGDLATGDGLAAAVSGVGTVVHCASSRTGDAGAARKLVRVAAGSSVSHVVYISIVGSDVITMGYYRAKVEAERAIVESGLPWTTLRATPARPGSGPAACSWPASRATGRRPASAHGRSSSPRVRPDRRGTRPRPQLSGTDVRSCVLWTL
jgi:uncharacterized protein YbjT (DUF2867 family)